MRAVIQRVSRASVTVGSEMISSIGRGICVLVGITREDGPEDVEYIVRKLINLRIFENSETGKRWDKSVKDLQAMDPQQAPDFYANFMNVLRKEYDADKIKDGQFGAMMSVSIENDGPVTITIDSKNRE